MRVGFGYDIHKLVGERTLILCGVTIPHEKGLLGHSDGDAAFHAIADAILGALGKDDIGVYFPNTDAAYKNVASSKILQKVNAFVARERMTINNVDLAIVAEAPSLKLFKEKMKQSIASVLKIEPRSVSVKAATNEGIGAIGKGEAIAAYAVVSLKEKNQSHEE